MPIGAKPLHVADQQGQLTMWALVEPSVDREVRVFDVFGTGHPISGEKYEFVGTSFAWPFVWHVFEETRIKRATPAWRRGPSVDGALLARW